MVEVEWMERKRLTGLFFPYVLRTSPQRGENTTFACGIFPEGRIYFVCDGLSI